MRWLLALIAGTAIPFSFAPFDLWQLAFVGSGCLFALIYDQAPARAWRLGWVFALPYFAIGVHWVYNSLHDFGAAAPPVAVGMTVLFVLVMTLFPALACWITARLRKQLHHPLLACLLFASAWSVSELLRGWLFGGFPWLLLGYSQTDSLFSAFAPSVGVYGISWLMVLVSAAMALLFCSWVPQLNSIVTFGSSGSPRGTRALLASVAALVVLSAVLTLPIEYTVAKTSTLRFRLVQGNIPQEMKFSEQRLLNSLQTYTQLSEENVEGVDVVIWPETAIPTTYARVEQALEPFVSRMDSQGVEVLSGGFHRDGDDIFNAFRQLGGDKALYTKRHLVPFGEYMPFRFVLDFVSQFVIIPMSDLTRGTGPANLLDIKGEKLGISICYEDVFGEEMAVSFPGATVLVNISNDAWFGNMPAPQQHQQIARMRSQEFQRELLRVTNTGITSAIDYRGRLRTSIEHNTQGIVDVDVVPRTGMTPYARWRNWPVIVLSVMILLLAGLRARQLRTTDASR